MVNGVYPRVCGGTGRVTAFVVAGSGLSPRVRGNLLQKLGNAFKLQKLGNAFKESVVAWIGAEMEFALSQAVASGDTFEHRPSECGHCVQDFLADLGSP